MEDIIYRNLRHIRKVVGKGVDIGWIPKRIQSAVGATRNIAGLMKAVQDRGGRLVDCWLLETLEDGICARALGVKGRMLLLYLCDPAQACKAAEHNIEVVAPNRRWVSQALKGMSAGAPNSKLQVHLWVDSGLGKEGFPTIAEGISEIRKLGRYILSRSQGGDPIEVAGIGTKFVQPPRPSAAAACNPDVAEQLLGKQLSRFKEIVAILRQDSVLPAGATVHAACSYEVASRFSDSFFDMVRVGNLALYGHDHQDSIRLKVPICDIKAVAPGWCFGYGCQFSAERPMRLALVPRIFGGGTVRYWGGAAGNRQEVPIPTINGGQSVNGNPVILDITDKSCDSLRVGSRITVSFEFDGVGQCGKN